MESRIETLRIRYERLIAANQVCGYASSGKASKYVKTIRAIKNEIYKEESKNREANRNSELRMFLEGTKGKSGFRVLVENVR